MALNVSAVALEKASLEPMTTAFSGRGVRAAMVFKGPEPVKLTGGMVPKVYLNFLFPDQWRFGRAGDQGNFIFFQNRGRGKGNP